MVDAEALASVVELLHVLLGILSFFVVYNDT